MKKIIVSIIALSLLVGCGHQRKATQAKSPDAAPRFLSDGKIMVFEQNNQTIGIMGSQKPTSKSAKDKLVKRDEAEREAIGKAGNTRPFGQDYPAASVETCGDISKWDDYTTSIGAKVLYAVAEMSREKEKDCEWSKDFLGCRGVLEIVKFYSNSLEPLIQDAKNTYQVCQK